MSTLHTSHTICRELVCNAGDGNEFKKLYFVHAKVEGTVCVS